MGKSIFKFTCYMCGCILVIMFTVYVGSILVRESGLQFEASSRVLVTAAHLGEVKGYTCIYSDTETDVGIYLKEGYRASAPPIGAEVTYLETKGWVHMVSDGEFIMEPLNIETIIPGVSGTPVYYKGEPLGFISGWDGNGRVRCIFY